MSSKGNEIVVYTNEEPNESIKPESRELIVDYSEEFATIEIFASREVLQNWVQRVGKRLGMVINVAISNKGANRRRRPYVVLECERAGEYRGKKKPGEGAEQIGKRITGSKKCNCPFRLKGTKLGNDDEDVGWELTVICGTHNHTDFENLQGHSYTGRLTKEEMVLVEGMSKSMMKPKAILRSLKMRDATNVTGMRTIYNVRQKLQLKENVGRSQMQLLFAKLVEDEYVYHHRVNDAKEVTNLLWTHANCVKLTRSYPYVFIMDCTYKINRYRLPLLEIVGATCTNKTFSIAFAYLEKEKMENYVWALRSLVKVLGNCPPPNCIVTYRDLALSKAVGDVYPSSHHLLCRWHVNKNILAKCKSMFATNKLWKWFQSSWVVLIDQESEELFNRDWDQMKWTFVDYPEAISYIAETWLDPYKEKIVSVWINKYRHLGTYTSNRAEGARGRIKRELGNSLGTLLDSFKHIHSLMMDQHDRIKESFEKSKNTYLHSFKLPIYSELRGHVSQYALEVIKLEVDKAKGLLPNCDMLCSCAIRSTHDIPCYHELREFVIKKCPIPLELVGSFWKHMSLEPISIEGDAELPSDAEAQELLHKVFGPSDAQKRKHLLTKLLEILSPETTTVVEPTEKVVTRGRLGKKLKVDRSTRRDPSLFEYHISKQDSCSPKVVPMSTVVDTIPHPLKPSEKTAPHDSNKMHEPIELRVPSQESSKPPTLLRKLPIVLKRSSVRKLGGKNLFLDQIHPNFQKYIQKIINVESDGHCGFRAVASMTGAGEHKWSYARADMYTELLRNEHIYLQMHHTRENLDELAERLNCWEAPAPRKQWMSLPNMGHLIASAYNIILVYLAPQQCLTFLPLASEPLPVTEEKNMD